MLIYPIDGYQGKNFYGVRPALNLDLTSNQWSYAGTVCSDGTTNEEKNNAGSSQENNSEDEHKSAYTAEHLEFINSVEYKERMDECWADILSKGLDTTTGKIGESLYKVLNTASEILSGQCKSLSIFDNPYDAVITELILAQTDLKESNIKLEYNNALLSGMSKLESICQKADPDWTLHASEYKTCLEKLIEDPKNYKDSNPVFYELCEKIFGGLAGNDDLNILLNAFGKAGELQSALNTYANVVNWVVDCLKYNALVQAYLSTSDEFKQSLKDAIVYMALNTSGDDFISRAEYGKMYEEAYEKFVAFQTTENISALLFKEYVSNGADRIENVFGNVIVKNAILYVSEALGISAVAASWLFACIEAYKTGWSISEAITNNGTNIECRELIRAYYYLEDAFMWEVETDAGNLKKEQTYANALKLDASYTILKNLECAVLDVYVKYLNNLQTSFAQGVLHGFSDYTEAEISIAKIWKLNWKNMKCHDRDESYKQYKTYSTVNICCPTDVFVYDKTGELVYSIENNTIAAKSEEIDGTVIGAMKFLLITDISKYVIHVVASDGGTMNYQVNTYDSASGTLIETANYLDVVLEEGDDYTGTFQEQILLQKNGNEVEPDYRITDADEKILVTAVEIKEPVQELKVNESKVLQINIEPSIATFPVLNWTSSDENIVRVDENGIITAVGSGECDIQCSAIDGSGLYDTITVKVVDSVGRYILGDINNDGKITMTDLLMCLHHVSGRTLLTGDAFLVADINDDGEVKMTDLLRILHYVSGRNTEL